MQPHSSSGSDATSCDTDIVVKLSRLGSGDGVVGHPVVFKIEAQGCSGSYQLAKGGEVFTTEKPLFFSRSYPTARTVYESVSVMDAKVSSKTAIGTIEFEVVPNTVGLACDATILSDGMLSVSAYGAASVSIVAIERIAGGDYTPVFSSPLPMALASAASSKLSLGEKGQYVFRFDVQDASDSSIGASCYALTRVIPGAAMHFLDAPLFHFGAPGENVPGSTKTLLVKSPSISGVLVQVLGISSSLSFRVVGGTCTPGAFIGAGSTCSIAVRFNPDAGSGIKTTTLALQTVSLSGGGIETATLVLQGIVD